MIDITDYLKRARTWRTASRAQETRWRKMATVGQDSCITTRYTVALNAVVTIFVGVVCWTFNKLYGFLTQMKDVSRILYCWWKDEDDFKAAPHQRSDVACSKVLSDLSCRRLWLPKTNKPCTPPCDHQEKMALPWPQGTAPCKRLQIISRLYSQHPSLSPPPYPCSSFDRETKSVPPTWMWFFLPPYLALTYLPVGRHVSVLSGGQIS